MESAAGKFRLQQRFAVDKVLEVYYTGRQESPMDAFRPGRDRGLFAGSQKTQALLARERSGRMLYTAVSLNGAWEMAYTGEKYTREDEPPGERGPDPGRGCADIGRLQPGG